MQRHVRGGGVMGVVRRRFPEGPDVEAAGLLAETSTVWDRHERLRVGDPRIVEFLTSFARRLLRPSVARRYPELGSLGFFLRRAEIDRALASVAAADPGVARFPRGTVFHVPPANVDTIFVYSWALSALAGNVNVVRVSERSAGAALAVLAALNETLAEADPVVAASQRMVTYGRDDAVTGAFSLACDLRVIWGGDASVAAVRRSPLSAGSRDVTFPDRSSFAVVSVDGWNRMDGSARDEVVAGFFNDVYWFDQAACASPRAIFWVGGAGAAREARVDFDARIAAYVASRHPEVDAAMAVEKRVATYGLAAEGAATRVRFAVADAVASVDLAGPGDVPRRWLGAGTFPHVPVGSLDEIVGVVGRRDQTVTYAGFTRADMRGFAEALGGRGVDRIVPVGRALDFAGVWDGFDLLREFTRLVTVA